MSDRRLVYAIAGLAVLGLGIAAYLTYIHYAGIKPVCLASGGAASVCRARATPSWPASRSRCSA